MGHHLEIPANIEPASLSPEEDMERHFQMMYWHRIVTPDEFRQLLASQQSLIERSSREQRILMQWLMANMPGNTTDNLIQCVQELASDSRDMLKDPACTPRGALAASEFLWVNHALSEVDDFKTLHIARSVMDKGPQPATTAFFARRTICRSSDQPQELAHMLHSAEQGNPHEHLVLATRSITHLPMTELQRASNHILEMTNRHTFHPGALAAFYACAILSLYEEKRSAENQDERTQVLMRLLPQLESMPDAEKERRIVRYRMASDAYVHGEDEVAMQLIEEAIALCTQEPDDPSRQKYLQLRQIIAEDAGGFDESESED